MTVSSFCFNSYSCHQAELEAKEKELDVGEAETVEQRDRSNAERAIEFYDELGSERVSLFFLFLAFF